MRTILFICFCFISHLSRSQVAGAKDAPLSVTPVMKFVQPQILAENSGMIFWNNMLWQHNDSDGDAAIYGMDTLDHNKLRRVTIKDAVNIDWEDIAQDDTHIYVGDIGNNNNGARPHFKIYKIAKADIINTTGNITVNADIIQFKYEDQPGKPVAVPGNTTNLDCEALICYNEKLYLFTKQWKGNKTILYELNKNAGNHIAVRKDSLDAAGLITGADAQPSSGRIVLTGYTTSGQRFIYLLYGYTNSQFFKGNKRKIILNGPSQLESVASIQPGYIFLGSESFSIVKQRVEALSLDSFFK